MTWKKIEQFSEDHPIEFVMTLMEIDVALASLGAVLRLIVWLQYAGVIPV